MHPCLPVELEELEAYIQREILYALDLHGVINEELSRMSYRGKNPYIRWLRHKEKNQLKRIHSAITYYFLLYGKSDFQ